MDQADQSQFKGNCPEIWKYFFKLSIIPECRMSAEYFKLRRLIGTAPKRKVDRQTSKLFAYLFYGTRGGFSRLHIIMLVLSRPRNANQLSAEMHIDYKAVRHHMQVLERNGLVCKSDGKYDVTYHASGLLEANIVALSDIVDRMEEKIVRDQTHR